MLLLFFSHQPVANIQCCLLVVAGQAAIPLWTEKNTSVKRYNEQKAVHTVTEAHLHLRKTCINEIRTRTYQIHAVRCTSRHRNRETHILPRKKDRMKITTRHRKSKKKTHTHTHPERRREKSSSQARKRYKTKKNKKRQTRE